MKLKEFQKHFKILTKEQVIGLLWQKHNDCKFAENEINRLEQQNAKLKNQIAEAGKKAHDKINFAISELKKAEENALKIKTQLNRHGATHKYKDCFEICWDIEKQIKELKETKK